MSQELAKKLRLNLDEPIYVIHPPTKEYFQHLTFLMNSLLSR